MQSRYSSLPHGLRLLQVICYCSRRSARDNGPHVPPHFGLDDMSETVGIPLGSGVLRLPYAARGSGTRGARSRQPGNTSPLVQTAQCASAAGQTATGAMSTPQSLATKTTSNHVPKDRMLLVREFTLLCHEEAGSRYLSTAVTPPQASLTDVLRFPLWRSHRHRREGCNGAAIKGRRHPRHSQATSAHRSVTPEYSHHHPWRRLTPSMSTLTWTRLSSSRT